MEPHFEKTTVNEEIIRRNWQLRKFQTQLVVCNSLKCYDETKKQEESRMRFGEKLQTLRKQKGMSQEQLAQKLSVSRQAVSKWELNQSLPDTEKVIILSKLFGVSIDYLLNEEMERNWNTDQQNRGIIQDHSQIHKKIKVVAGAVSAAVGILGSVVLFVLSTIIPVHVTKKAVLPDGSVRYYGGGDVLGYEFWTFIEEYHLMAVLILFLVLAVGGILLILSGRLKKSNE